MAARAQARKERLISDLLAARQDVLMAALALTPAQREEVFLGTWSARDLLAHLAGWDFANLEAVQAILSGRRPAFWAYQDRDWHTFNARLVAQYRRDDLGELLARLQDSHLQLITFLEAVPAAEFFRARGRDRISTLLRTEVRDEFEHGRQIREFAARG